MQSSNHGRKHKRNSAKSGDTVNVAGHKLDVNIGDTHKQNAPAFVNSDVARVVLFSARDSPTSTVQVVELDSSRSTYFLRSTCCI